MNRHERRKATAKTRRAHPPRDEGRMVLGSRSLYPDDIKADICRVVRAIYFIDNAAGNRCAVRAAIGWLTLRLLGLAPRLYVGSMLYRAGPHPLRDVVSFCGYGNTGQLVDGGFAGHVWLEMDDELIDFTCGDWPHLDPAAALDDAETRRGNIHWDIVPPTFVWCTRALFEWHSSGSPQMDEMW